jgi:uncharacterized protein (DUF1810 family)
MAMQNPAAELFNLDRFLHAHVPIYRKVLAELKRGSKRTQSMCFISRVLDKHITGKPDSRTLALLEQLQAP